MVRTYNISGMTCSGCAQVVYNLLSKVEGVDNVEVSLERKEAVVEMEEDVSVEALEAALKNSPYGVVGER